MDGDTVAHLLWSAGALTLVGSALLTRRIPMAHVVRNCLAWIVIFGLVYIGFAFRAEGGALWQRLAVAATGPASAANVSGRGVQIKQAEDGHFWAQVSLNGVSVRALIDSGASVTMISHDVAVAAKIEPSPGPPALVDTANGTIRAQPARIARLSIGAINRNDERAEISDGVSDVSVLGMSFLSGLKSWHVENDTLTLQP